MSTKFTKEELKSPDQVTKTLRQGFVWTTAHSKLVVGAVAAFVVVGIGVSVAGYFSEKKEISQQEKYFLIEKSYTDKKRGFEEAAKAEMNQAVQAQQAKKDKKAASPAFDPSKKASGDIQKDYGSVITSFDSFISEAPNTKAAQMAALNLSDIYLFYKKTDEALATLQKVEKGLDKSGVLTGLVWMQIGNILADKTDCKGAIEKWQTVANNKDLAFAHDEAKLRMGLCFESLNEVTKAEELYAEISKKGEQGTTDFAASREAQKYLRLLKVKKNL